MCLLLIAIDASPRWPLLILGNRDEFHARATAAAAIWPGDGRVAGGRDLVANGSWLAVRDDGRFAAVTNLRTGVPATAPCSRGWLVRDFVLGEAAPPAFLQALEATADAFGPFNLVVGDRRGVWAMGSADRRPRAFGPGVHVVSNGPIGVHWPKTQRLRERFAAVDASAINDAAGEEGLLDVLADEMQPADDRLPSTGVGIDLERRLAPVFIRGAQYGTRASTLYLRDADGGCVLHERRFGPVGAAAGSTRLEAGTAGGFRATER